MSAGPDPIKTNNKISYHKNFKIAAFDPSKTLTKPHRHNKYLEIIYFETATGVHYIDSEGFTIASPCISCVGKDQVHYWEIKDRPKGYVAIFKEAFLEELKDKYLVFLLQSIQEIDSLTLQTKSKPISYLFEMLTESDFRNSVNLDERNESLLKALLLNILEDADKDCLNNSNAQVKEFINYLQSNPRNDVGFYAGLLHMSPQNLNFFCKKHFSLTASEVVNIYVNREAQRLLLYSKLSISEIAYKLHFKDVSYFIKYFKQHNKLTPLKYRTKTDNYHSFFK